jgi:hypothetical protein
VKRLVVVALAIPWRARRDDGVEEEIPTLPLLMIERSEVPVEDATLNGLTPAVPCTLKVTVPDVALTPDTVPLSRKRPVVRAEAEDHRARNPLVPPERLAAMLRDEVETHCVEVPVARRI